MLTVHIHELDHTAGLVARHQRHPKRRLLPTRARQHLAAELLDHLSHVLVEEAGVLEGDAHASRERLQQAYVAFTEAVFAIHVIERDEAMRLVAYHERRHREGPGYVAHRGERA